MLNNDGLSPQSFWALSVIELVTLKMKVFKDSAVLYILGCVRHSLQLCRKDALFKEKSLEKLIDTSQKLFSQFNH